MNRITLLTTVALALHVLQVGSAHGQLRTVKEASAANRAAANSAAASTRATANRMAAVNAMKNAATLASRRADHLVNPPMRDYSRTDRRAVETILADSVASASVYRSLRDNAETDYKLWEKGNEDALVDYYRSILDRFKDPREMKDVGSSGYILDPNDLRGGLPRLRIDRIGSDGGWLNRRYGWWIEGIDVSKKFDGDEIPSEDYVFEVIGQKKIDTIKDIDIATATIRRVRATKKPMEDLPDRPVPPPAPVGITEWEAMTAVFPDARDLTMGGKTATCGYIRRVRVQTRKYDVYVVLLHDDALHLAWVPWSSLDKADAIWVAKTDRARTKAKAKQGT